MSTKFNHVNLLSTAPDRLRDFYMKVFGFTLLEHMSNPPSFYMLDGNGCRLSIQDAMLVDQPTGQAGIELGFEVTDLPSIIEKMSEFPTAGKSKQQQMDWGHAFSATDPEGHLLNVYTFHTIIPC